MKRIALIAAASACLIATPALAQGGAREGGARRSQMRQQQIDPEQAKAAWTLQARGVVGHLELDDAQTAKVVEAYLAARTNYGKALREQREKMREERGARRGGGRGEGAARGEGRGEGAARGQGRGGPDREAMRAQREKMRALADSERAKLETALAEVLSGKQLIETSRVLGSFNPQWDRLVVTVAGLDAGEEKTMAALAPIEKYVATTVKIRADGDRETMRESMREARDELHASLSYVLTEPQLDKVLATMQRGRRGPGGGDRARDGSGQGRGQPRRDDA